MSWVWEKATDAIEDVGGVVTDVVEGVGGAVLDAVEDVGDVVTGIIEDPKKLAAVAISVAFPGAGTAIGQSLLGPALSASIGAVGTQIIGQTIINTAINGGDLEQGLLTAGVSAMTPMLAKEISNTAVEQGIDKTIANAGAKVAAGTIQAAALGQDPLTAFTFGAVDQATDAILNKAITESGLQKEFSALPAPAKIAVSSAITSALTGADASMLAANQIVQNAIGMATQEVKRQDAKEFFRNQFSDIGYDMTEDELDQVFQNIDSRDQAKNLAQEIKDFPSFEYYKNFGGDKEKFEEFVEKTEEDKIVEFLESQGVSPTPERVAAIAKEFNIDITKPVEGLSSAVDRYKQSNVLSADEVKQIAQSKGISITDDEAMRYVGEGDKSSLQSRLDSFLDFKASDQKQLQTNNAKIATNILDALEAEGYTPEAISKLIDDGTVQRYVDQYKQAQQQTVENLRNNAVFAEQQFGSNSEQALQARRDALDAMSAFGGYGVSKDQQGNFKTADAPLDAQTLLPIQTTGLTQTYDPVTGVTRIGTITMGQTTYGDWLSKQKDQPYAGLIASGQSANPPETGGRSVFGSGSGVQGSLPGLSLVAIDDGTGAKVYEDMNGKALVMYSDGKAFIKDKDSDQINWINLQEIPRIIEELEKIDIKTEQDTKQKDQAIAEINKNIDEGFVNPSEALELLRNQGFNPTEADAQKISGLKTSEQAAQEAAQYAQANTVTRDEARQALIEAGVTNPTDFDIDALVGQYAQTDLTSKVQQAKPMAEIRSAVRDVIGEGNSVAVDEIRKQMQANEESGLSRDQALNKAIDDVATSVGTTKQDLMNMLGQTDQSLRNLVSQSQEKTAQDIAGLNTQLTKAIEDAKVSGLAGDAALQAGINAVANSVGSTKEELLAEIGITEQSLRDLYTTGQQQTSTSISNLQKTLADQIAANEAAGLSRDAATNKAIQDVSTNLGTTKEQLLGQINQTEQSLRDLYTTGQQQTATQITDLQKSLSDKIAANEAAGLSRDEATNKAIQDVSANLGTTKEQLLGQIGQTEQSLRDLYTTGQQQTQEKISALDASTQAKFDALTQEQQNQALALAQSTNDLKGAINTIAQTSSEQLAGVKSELEGQLTAQGKSIMDALVKQGVDYNTALNTAMTQQGEKLAETEKTLTGQISGLSASTQAQFGAMSAAQQAEVAARVQMGEELGKAIGDVSGQVAGLGSQVSGLGAELEAQRKADEAYRAEQAKADEEAAKKATQQAQSARFAAMLPALGIGLGAGATQPVVDESIPQAKAEFLTTKGDTKFEGLLSDFQQKVEENDGLFDNPTTEEGSRDMGSYYSYGNEMPVDSVLGLGGDQQTDSTDSSQNPYDRGYFFAQGGMVAPLMAAQGGHMSAGTRYGKYAKGGMPSPLMAAGGKMRVDFRKGDAVTGPGDGQSDDIPAMLADGEFVFPADVVAAIGNGSTKAGSDALYDMMHSIRAHVRSAKPKDLPPEIKSPLDFLKTKKRRA